MEAQLCAGEEVIVIGGRSWSDILERRFHDMEMSLSEMKTGR